MLIIKPILLAASSLISINVAQTRDKIDYIYFTIRLSDINCNRTVCYISGKVYCVSPESAKASLTLSLQGTLFIAFWCPSKLPFISSPFHSSNNVMLIIIVCAVAAIDWYGFADKHGRIERERTAPSRHLSYLRVPFMCMLNEFHVFWVTRNISCLGSR